MLIVTCKVCGFAIGSCICGKHIAETQFPKGDDPRLIEKLEARELRAKILAKIKSEE